MAMKHRESIEDVKAAAEKVTLQRIEDHKQHLAAQQGTTEQSTAEAPAETPAPKGKK